MDDEFLKLCVAYGVDITPPTFEECMEFFTSIDVERENALMCAMSNARFYSMFDE